MSKAKERCTGLIAALAALTRAERGAVIRSLITTDREAIRRELQAADDRDWRREIEDLVSELSLEPIELEVSALDAVALDGLDLPGLDLSFPAPLCSHCRKAVTPSRDEVPDGS